MAAFLMKYWGSFVIGAVLLAVIALIVIKLCRNRKKGKSSCGCGCGCGNCPSSGMCHSRRK